MLAMGFQFFDKKPFIVKPWEKTMSMKKDDIKYVLLWIQLPQLDFMYWGENSLFKIVVMVDKPLKMDQATLMREKPHFARVLVKMSLTNYFLDSIEYEDAYGTVMNQHIVYEWKSVFCGVCKGMGDSAENCVMKTKVVWQPKVQTQKHIC